MTTNHLLSSRGEHAAEGNDLSLLFDILADLYDKASNPDGFVSLGVAENYLMHDVLVEYINANFALTANKLTYGEGGNGSKRLREAVAHFLNRKLQPVLPISYEHVVVTNGLSSAIEHCSWMLGDPGDGVLLGQPHYGAFSADIEYRPSLRLVKVKFDEVDPVGFEGAKRYESAIMEARERGIKVKALMLCHPHNPLGRCYSRETITELMRICQKHRIHLISDEIYALSVWKNNEDAHPAPTEFVSVLSLNLEGIIDPQLVHVLWGLSKDFGANGLRMGTIISQSNPAFVKALRTVTLYSYVSGMADAMASKLLFDDDFTDRYLVENSEKLSKQYSTAVAFLRKHDIEYASGSNAAFFIWINLGKAYHRRHPERGIDEAELFQRLLDKKVFLANGVVFGSEKPGWFRIVFSHEDESLLEGLRRVADAIQ